MKAWHRPLVALGLLAPACSPAPTAHRSTQSSAAPPAESGTDATAAPAATSTVPAPMESAGAGLPSPAPAGPTTTVTVSKLPPDTTGATVTTMRPRPAPTTIPPEKAHEDESDEEWGAREAILACIRSYEGDYATATGNGHWGAYQFVQSTWDGAVAAAGYPQWVGRRASDAPAHVQDDAAWALYLQLNFGPWPPASRYCRGVA